LSKEKGEFSNFLHLLACLCGLEKLSLECLFWLKLKKVLPYDIAQGILHIEYSLHSWSRRSYICPQNNHLALKVLSKYLKYNY